MFKVGDIVVATENTWGIRKGDVCKVVEGGRGSIGVESERFSGGHACDGRGNPGHCWYVDPSILTLHSVNLENK